MCNTSDIDIKVAHVSPPLKMIRLAITVTLKKNMQFTAIAHLIKRRIEICWRKLRKLNYNGRNYFLNALEMLVLSGEITTAPPETFRYVKWANYVLDYSGGDMPTYMDLWVIASVFERRDALGIDMADLEAWLTYRPYNNADAEYSYLDAVGKGSIPMLNTGNLFQEQDKRIKGSKDMYKQWSKLHDWSNKDHISELSLWQMV